MLNKPYGAKPLTDQAVKTSACSAFGKKQIAETTNWTPQVTRPHFLFFIALDIK